MAEYLYQIKLDKTDFDQYNDHINERFEDIKLQQNRFLETVFRQQMKMNGQDNAKSKNPISIKMLRKLLFSIFIVEII